VDFRRAIVGAELEGATEYGGVRSEAGTPCGMGDENRVPLTGQEGAADFGLDAEGREEVR